MKRNRWRNRRTPRENPSLLERINPDVAGIDCGASEHFVAVPIGRDQESVRSFRTFTPDLNRLAEWLRACGVRSVAIEATGVYWIPLFEILEAHAIEVLLVNAHHVKNVAGRKSDVLDCEWLRELHSVGLLRASFRPADAIVALRGYMRHRETLVRDMSDAIRRMQKALVQMNVLLPQVVTDVTGVTGLSIMKDIAAGRTDPGQLVLHRDARCHATPDEFVAALTGNYRPEHVFALRQNLSLYDYYQLLLSECDTAIELHLKALTAQVEQPTAAIPSRRGRSQPRSKEPHFDIRGYLYRLTGVDLSQIDGVGPYQALKLLSEIGIDMGRWPTEQHFTSWLALAPNNRISGGRLLSSRTPASGNRAAAILRLIAMSLTRTQTALGAFYRRLAARRGKPKAITATARKVAILVYRMLKGELEYRDPGPEAYNSKQRQRIVRRLRNRAQAMGFALVAIDTGELSPAGVS